MGAEDWCLDNVRQTGLKKLTAIPPNRRKTFQWRIWKGCSPMNNHSILVNFFDLCSVQLLKKVRLVSKQWYKLSMKSWRGKAVLRVSLETDSSNEPDSDDEMSLETGWKKEEDGEVIKIVRLKKMFDFQGKKHHHLIKTPFTSYEIVDPFPLYLGNKVESIRAEVELMWFFQTFGSHIKYLNLSTCVFSLDPRMLHWIYLYLPKLESLTVTTGFKEGKWIFQTPWMFGTALENLKSFKIGLLVQFYRNEEFSWEQLFRSMPNLERFIVRVPKHLFNSSGSYNLLKTVFTAARQSTRLRDLDLLIFQRKNFSWRLSFPLTVINVIRECHFPLQRLAAGIEYNCKLGMILYLLEPYCQTLEYLRLFREPGNAFGMARADLFRKLGAPTLRMGRLKEIRLGESISVGFHLLRFLDLPKIEKLVFDETFEYERGEELPDWGDGHDMEAEDGISITYHQPHLLHSILRGVVMSTVHTFEIRDTRVNLTEERIKVLARSMPNVRHLVIPVIARSFPAICETWRDLISLEILRGPGEEKDVINDEAITGIRRRGVVRNAANITMLKDLSSLRISNKLTLTRHSVLHGFLHLPKLLCLNVTLTPLPEEVKKMLVEKVQDLRIQVSNEDFEYELECGSEICAPDGDWDLGEEWDLNESLDLENDEGLSDSTVEYQ